MIIGIVGAGTFGFKLATLFLHSGLRVLVGSRSAERGQELGKRLGCMGGDQSYCISNSDIIFAVIPYHTSDGRDNMALFLDTHRDILPGKSVVDLSNLFYRTPPVDFDTEKYKSGLEFHRDVVNDSSVSLVAGYKVINNTSLLTTRQGVEICGDDKAKAQLSEIIEATGWWVIDRGGVESAPLLEPKGPLRERPDDPREIEHLEDAISMADDTMP